jgi:threonyl-tRNA synthetase
MATPIASSSQPAQIPALDGPHAGNAKKPKEKKDKTAAAASQYPIEVSNLRRCSSNFD